MGGYGNFVWGSYGVFTAVLLWILLTPIIKRRQLMKQLKQQHALQAAQKVALERRRAQQ
ncbi:MAG: heme exporter protein CcmD [Lysobacterales bacterium]